MHVLSLICVCIFCVCGCRQVGSELYFDSLVVAIAWLCYYHSHTSNCTLKLANWAILFHAQNGPPLALPDTKYLLPNLLSSVLFQMQTILSSFFSCLLSSPPPILSWILSGKLQRFVPFSFWTSFHLLLQTLPSENYSEKCKASSLRLLKDFSHFQAQKPEYQAEKFLCQNNQDVQTLAIPWQLQLESLPFFHFFFFCLSFSLFFFFFFSFATRRWWLLFAIQQLALNSKGIKIYKPYGGNTD